VNELHLDLDGHETAQLAVQPIPVEPHHPTWRLRLEPTPGCPTAGGAVNRLGLVVPDDALDWRLVTRNPDATDGVGQTEIERLLRERQRRALRARVQGHDDAVGDEGRVNTG
jgi:hypothetical protein